MGKKNRRKNNANNSKVNQGLKAEQLLKQAQDEAQLLKQQQELRGKLCANQIQNDYIDDESQINASVYQYGMEYRHQEFSAEELQMIRQSQKHLQIKELEQCRATKEQMVQKIIQEGRNNQHIPLHHRYPVQQQQQYQIYGQQNIQLNDHQMHHCNQYQITRNHHLSNLNSLSQKESTQTMMIRRFERKQISKSCDDAIKRQNYHNSYEDEEEMDCNDIYQADHQEIQKQQYHLYLPQNEGQYQNCDDMEGHDEDEEQIEYNENQEFDCQQNLQIQYCNKRDLYNHYGKKIFQQNHGGIEDDKEYEEEDDGEDEDDDDEDEDEEEEDEHEDFDNGDFAAYDEDNQNFRFIQTNILQKNLNVLQFAQNEQLLSQLEKKQILQGNRQQQQLQIKQYQKQQLQYLLEQQQLQNAQQGKQKQNNLSLQQQQALQQKQILQQQQQLQIFNSVNLQQLQQKQQNNQNIQQINKNYAPSTQQMQQHQYINQNNSYYANGSQSNQVNQISAANYQSQSQQQKNRGCKTPSTDDNSESFNHSARTNSFQKNTKQSSQSLKKSSVEKVAVYGKPKSESEKKLAPSHNSFISQEANLALLSQQKFKYLKDEHLDLEQILNKIYFDEYKYDELKEFVIPALREIQNINNFFDILFNSIRIYAEDVKQKIINKIKQINLACSGIAESQQNRIVGVSEFEQIINKNFHKQSEAFISITNQIYEQYQAVEKYSKQTEKIVYLYINHFIEKNRSIRFNCEDLHRRIFIFFVFADPQINNYLEAKINYFRSKGLSGSKYHECFIQLNKMHDILIRKNQYIPSEEHPINIEIYEKETCDEEEEEEENQNDDRFYQGQPHISQQTTMNQKLLKKRNQKKSKNLQLKKSQQQLVQGQYNEMTDLGQTEFSEQINGLCEYISRLDDDSEIKKKKKKKKKNKSAAANKDEEQNQAQDEELPRDSSAEKIKKSEGKKKGPSCHMNEELEQFQRRLEESNKNLKEHQKIQPIIAENWIIKIKERYAKLKVKLNK